MLTAVSSASQELPFQVRDSRLLLAPQTNMALPAPLPLWMYSTPTGWKLLPKVTEVSRVCSLPQALPFQITP